jgi:hypothetical protein
MAALVRSALKPGAMLAPHIPLHFVDWRCLGTPDDVQRNRLMGVAAKAFDFEIIVSGVECVTKRRGWLRRSLKAEHARIPCLASQTVGAPSGSGRVLGFCSDRLAEEIFPGLGCHGRNLPVSGGASKPLPVAATAGAYTTGRSIAFAMKSAAPSIRSVVGENLD